MRAFARSFRAVAAPRPSPPQAAAATAAWRRGGRATTGLSRDFSQLPLWSARTGLVQARRDITAPGDRHEQEADRLADQVMHAPARDDGRNAPMRRPSFAPSSATAVAAPRVVDDTLASPGQSLDRGTGQFMASRFGQDFSHVRVHTGERAAASASAIGARAYASGSHVVFGAGQYAPGTAAGRQLLAHELAHVVQQAAVPGAGAPVQREPVDRARPTRPRLVTEREGVTDRIDDAYGRGTLDEKHWKDLLAAAESAFAAGRTAEAQQDYLALYADLARLAQVGRVVGSPDTIHPVTGDKSRCMDARPGLNFSMLDRDGWGANATTAFVGANGKFGVPLAPPGTLQPEVAIVLTRSAFRADKEQSLGILRHEMIHADHDADDALAFAGAPKAARSAAAGTPRGRRGSKPPEGPKRTSDGNSEVLGYVEGFMTMFPLARPAPTDLSHPAFVELLGVLDTGGGVHPWAEADASIRAQALGRLQECYCHAMDDPHRASFDGWVGLKSAQVQQDQLASGEPASATFAPGGVDDRSLEILQNRHVDRMGAMLRLQLESADFFHGLRGIVANRCKGLSGTKMKL